VYGYDASNDRLLASADEGRNWKEFDKPAAAPIVDLAPDPSQPLRLVATAIGGFGQGMYASSNGGQSWKRLNYAVGLMAWPTRNGSTSSMTRARCSSAATAAADW